MKSSKLEDNFSRLFDSYIDRKKKEKGEKVSMPLSFDNLPIWKDVCDDKDYCRCLICQRNLDPEDLVEQCYFCGMYFHYDHYREWMKIKGECPVCRNR
ncbi:MAG: RING finger protein [Candidatus Odinarchaeota archaeon]